MQYLISLRARSDHMTSRTEVPRGIHDLAEMPKPYESLECENDPMQLYGVYSKNLTLL